EHGDRTAGEDVEIVLVLHVDAVPGPDHDINVVGQSKIHRTSGHVPLDHSGNIVSGRSGQGDTSIADNLEPVAAEVVARSQASVGLVVDVHVVRATVARGESAVGEKMDATFAGPRGGIS